MDLITGGGDSPSLTEVSDGNTYYVSSWDDEGGVGTSNEPFSLKSAFDQISSLQGNYVIILVDDLYHTGTNDLNLRNNEVTLIGDGHTISSSGSITAMAGSILHLGKSDGSDTLTFKEVVRAQAHSIVSAYGGTIHMYDGVQILGADDAEQNGSSGHGVSVNGGKFYMNGGTISGFSLPNPGPAILITYGGECQISGGTISNCHSQSDANQFGGAIFADGKNGKITVTITGGTFCDNVADNRGGAIASQSDVVISISGDAVFFNNSAGKGGAISIQNDAILSITDGVQFIDNKSEGNGGAIQALSGCKVTISDGVSFIDNSSTNGYGGAIYHQRDSSGMNQPLTVQRVSFEGNTATYGGAITVLGGLGNKNPITTLISGCEFVGNGASVVLDQENNTDGGYGGAIFVQDVLMTIEDSQFLNNGAEEVGGAIVVSGGDSGLTSIEVSGTIVIKGNHSQNLADNLYLDSIELSGNKEQIIIDIIGSLSSGSEIGVCMDVPGIFTSGFSNNCGQDPSRIFFSDNPGYHVELIDGEACLVEGGEFVWVVEQSDHVSVDPNHGIALEGEKVSITLIPDAGFISKGIKIISNSGETISYDYDGNGNYCFIMPASDVTITIKLEQCEYTVSFYVLGDLYKSFHVTYASQVPSPDDPCVPGYIFRGWDGPDPSLPVTSDVRYDAILFPAYITGENDDSSYIPPNIVYKKKDDNSDLWLAVVCGSIAAMLFMVFIVKDRRRD